MSASKTPKKQIIAAANPADELAIERLNSRISKEDSEIWDQERAFGLRLRANGTWERHPPKPVGAEPQLEIPEPDKGSPFDEPAGYGDDKPIRTLSDFALYDEFGRLIPLEALEHEAITKVIAFGTLVEPSKVALQYPAPPQADRWNDPYAGAVFIQPAPVGVPMGQTLHANGMDATSILFNEVVDILDKLLVSPVTRGALLQTGLAHTVYRLQRHDDATIQYRALALRMSWSDLLDRGGSEPDLVDIGFLQVSAAILKESLESSPLNSTIPSSFSSSTFQLNTLINMEDFEEDDLTELVFEPDRKKPRAGVNSAEIIAEYYFNGKAVEPSGPHESRLKQMVDYVRELLNCNEDELAGWRMAVHRRRKGNAFGQMDSYFFSPEGRRYRSRNEVGKAFEAGTFGQARSKGGRPPASGQKLTGSKAALEAPKPTVVSPLANLNPVALPMPPVEDLDNVESSHARRPFYEFGFSAPKRSLDATLSQEAREALRPVAPADVESRVRYWEHVQENAEKKVVRVRLELTGWAISSDIGSAALYVHTDKAAYRLAGDLVLARPAPFYYSIFASSFLAFEACRLTVRVLAEYSPHVQYAKLTFAEVLQEILARSRRVPGRSSPSGPRKLIVPNSSLRFFYYPCKDRLSADFVVSRYLLVQAIASRHFVRNTSVVDTPFFDELNYENTRRAKLEEKNLVWALQEEQKRRASEKRKALREEVREKERIQTLVKRLEQDYDLRPEDTYLVRGSPSDIARACTLDPLLALALEKFLSSTQGPAHTRPPLASLNFDPAFADGVELFESLDAGNKTLSTTLIDPVRSNGATVRLTVPTNERLLITGRLLEMSPVSVPDELGETFSRMLHIWDGASHFARAKGKAYDEAVGSFPKLRRQLYESALTAPVFVDMLRAVAEDDIERRTPPTASLEDLCYHLAADPAFDSAFDTTVWPPPLWLIDETTWTELLRSAMCDWLRHHPEMAALEAIECGEVGETSLDNLGSVAGMTVRAQAAPAHLDFIALCDDGLRALVLDPDADEFCRPVDRSLFPDYDQIVSRPMDLSSIRDRIAQGHYDPKKAPEGAYFWNPETMIQISKKLESSRPANQESDDDDDDPEEKPSFNYLTLLAEYRSGGGTSSEKPDCGKCKNCLDKPRFGGYNTLRLPCKLKQQAEQLQSAAAPRGGDANKKVKTKDLWKRRQAALAREEAMVKFDEMYLAHDCLGGGHEGLAADVRLVFRNCRVYNKGTTPIYRAASKLDSMFNAYYLRLVASRDPKYAVPRVVKFPEILTREHASLVDSDDPADAPTVLSRIRRSFPSVVAAVRALGEAKELSQVPFKARTVALEWLVDRALETVKSSYISARFMDARAALTDPTVPPADAVVLGVEPPGVTRDMLRVWAVPHMIRETGGLVLFENLKTAQWSYVDDLGAFEAFVLSLDPRGRRESQLKKNLERILPEVETAMKEASRDFIQAVQQLKTGARELDQLKNELETIQSEIPQAQVAVDQALESAKREWEAKHQEAEEQRRNAIEERRKMWAEAQTDDGKVYYYNTLTRNTQWTRPKEMDIVFEASVLPPLPDTPSPAQGHLSTLLLKAEAAKERIEKTHVELAKARSEVGRDRALLSFLKKVKVDRVALPESPEKGGAVAVTNLAVSLLALERFCQDPSEAQRERQESFWETEGERLAWIKSVEALPGLLLERGESIDSVLAECKAAILSFYNALIERGPFSRAESFINQRLLFEHWRWETFLAGASRFGDICVCLVHLRRFFLEQLNAPHALDWVRSKKLEIL